MHEDTLHWLQLALARQSHGFYNIDINNYKLKRHGDIYVIFHTVECVYHDLKYRRKKNPTILLYMAPQRLNRRQLDRKHHGLSPLAREDALSVVSIINDN
jgi:hypothetical protein